VFASCKRNADGERNLEFALGKGPRLCYLGALGEARFGPGAGGGRRWCSGGGLRSRATEGAGSGLWAFEEFTFGDADSCC